MEVLLCIAIGLFIIAAIAVGHTVRKHNKMFKEGEDPVPCDMPGMYEDVQYCERPYIEML